MAAMVKVEMKTTTADYSLHKSNTPISPYWIPPPSSIFRFLIGQKKTSIGKKDSWLEVEKKTTRAWATASVLLQDLPLLQMPHRQVQVFLLPDLSPHFARFQEMVFGSDFIFS